MLGEGVTRESDVDRAMRVQASVFSGRDVVKDLREIHGDIREHNMQQAGAKPVAAR
jgi:aminoglycoside phosphotransferase family enzyme